MKALTASEGDIHRQIADLLTRAIAPAGIPSMHGVMWFTVEMRTSSTRDRCERQRRGVRPGMGDITVLHAGRHLEIELKRPVTGRQSADQRRHMNAIIECECRYAVCTGWEQVMAALAAWGIPHRRVS
jgi:hypothetical protein